MPKLVQLLALAAVVAMAASTPVSHLFKDDKVDMALEDLEVLADALEKETSHSSSFCCPSGQYGPGGSQCKSCGGIKMTSSGYKYSNGVCQNTQLRDCKERNMGNMKGDSRDSSGSCPRGQYGPTSSKCKDCNADETSDVGSNIENWNCFKCNACQSLKNKRCESKCITSSKPHCSLTATKVAAAGVCHKK